VDREDPFRTALLLRHELDGDVDSGGVRRWVFRRVACTVIHRRATGRGSGSAAPVAAPASTAERRAGMAVPAPRPARR
jgi:hypothetical protein